MSKRRMGKFLAPADRVLAEIGRFVLIRPRIAGLLLITAILITIFSNNLRNTGEDLGASTVRPATLNLSIADDTDSDIPSSPSPMLPTPVISADSSVNANSQALTPVSEPAQPIKPAEPVKTTATTAPAAPAKVTAADSPWQTVTVRKGDNLAKIFKRNHLSAADLNAISTLSGVKKAVHGLQIGQELRYQTDAKGGIQQLVLPGKNTVLTVSAAANGFQIASAAPDSLSHEAPKSTVVALTPPPITQTASNSEAATATQPVKIAVAKTEPGRTYVSGEIQHYLTKDAHKAGLSTQQAAQLAQLFSVKGITQKLKAGDEFNVLYDSSGKKQHGSILAAQLIHAGQRYQLIRFTSPDGHTDYYNPQGQSSQPGLVRAPLNYNHLSSGFSYRRFDPVLRVVHAHLGVDYAAPQGTPVKAAGDGVIASAAYRGGYGRSIIIQHDAKYSTLYAHLSRFADLKVGSRVKQGQVIGYVGQSGFATGPHLHYEIHVNNVPNNPLTVALPGKQIPATYRSQFLAQSRVLLAQLQSNRKIQLAESAAPSKKS